MLRNVCGERIGKNLLKRMRAMRTPSLQEGSRVRSFRSLKTVRRLFSRLKRARRVEQKVKVALVSKVARPLIPSPLRKKTIAIPTPAGRLWSALDSFVVRSLSKKNASLKKVLRNHQKTATDEDAADVSLDNIIFNREAMATWFAISSLFSFLFSVLACGIEAMKNRIRETENDWSIFSLNGVQNV